jgi:hypothetical protein
MQDSIETERTSMFTRVPPPPQPGPCATSFPGYVDSLAELLRSDGSPSHAVLSQAALDGQVSRNLRALVPLAHRRAAGAFFTSQALADRLLAGESDRLARGEYRQVADAACGCGDLLLAAARSLPLAANLTSTLRRWGRLFVGRDTDPLYARAARLRLALLASVRHGRPWTSDEDALTEIFSEICVGDGTSLALPDPRTLLLLNPPFGYVASERAWGSGRLARAGVFFTEVLEQLSHGATVRAILPDVLRSGTNYRRWREHVEHRARVDSIEVFGQFDPWTDVDVFLIHATVGEAGNSAAWWRPSSGLSCVRDFFEARVGTVVPHRDLHVGPVSPFLRAHELPQSGIYQPAGISRAHSGRRFTPPLVVVRRTSRPEAHRPRVVANIVVDSEPVLVENHLLVCLPRDGTLKSCERLVKSLTRPETTEWLNQRLRCRHLTVSALREVPLPSWRHRGQR